MIAYIATRAQRGPLRRARSDTHKDEVLSLEPEPRKAPKAQLKRLGL